MTMAHLRIDSQRPLAFRTGLGVAAQNLGSTSKISTSNLRFSVAQKTPKASPKGYRRLVNRILADREGKKTWPELERLEGLAEHSQGARAALVRLDLLSGVQDYQEASKPAIGQTQGLARSLDGSSPRLAREGWNKALNGTSLEKKLTLLKSSEKSLGWKTLGYPGSITAKSASLAAPGWEDPTKWRNLVEGVVRRQVRDNEGSQNYREYRQLLAAYRHLDSSNLRDKVDATELWFDMNRLENKLRPEQLESARKEVREKVGDQDAASALKSGGKGRGQRFLSRLTRMPDSLREKQLHDEFSLLSLKSPEELRGYAELLQQEAIKRGKDASSLNPLIQKVFSKVAREASGRPTEANKVVEPHAFRRLMREMTSLVPSLDNRSEGGQLEIYRSGLTVDGMTRNYVLTRAEKKPHFGMTAGMYA